MRLGLAAALAFVVLAQIARSQTQKQIIPDPAPTTADAFGEATALDGASLLIGARGDDSGGFNQGAVYVFGRTKNQWILEQRLLASAPDDDDQFGSSADIDGDYAVIGAWKADSLGNDSGAAYVFRKVGGLWLQQAELFGTGVQPGDEFGISVAIDGNTLVVGSHLDDEQGIDTGAAYVFERLGTDWSQQDKIIGNDSSAGDHFGRAVDLDGDRIIAGSPLAVGAGEAWIFARDGTKWKSEKRVRGSPPVSGTEFGHAVAICGETAVVGAPLDDAVALDAGAVYAFFNTGATWAQEAKIHGSNLELGDRFGRSIAIDGRTLLVGSPQFDVGNQGDAGALHVFHRQGAFPTATWPETARLISDPVLSGQELGHSVALDVSKTAGTQIIAGAPRLNSGGMGSVYSFGPCVFTYCTAKVNSCGSTPEMQFEGSSSASSSAGFVLTGTNAREQKLGLLLYTDQGDAVIPFQGGVLCVQLPLSRACLISSGGSTTQCNGTLSMDMNTFASGSLGWNPQPYLTSPGTTVNAQWWGRDKKMHGSYLSNGIEYVVGP